MSNDEELGPLNGTASKSKFESLIALDNAWRQKHQGNYVAMGSAVILASEPTVDEVIEVGNRVAEEKGVRMDFFAKVDRDAQKAAIEARNERFDLG